MCVAIYGTYDDCLCEGLSSCLAHLAVCVQLLQTVLPCCSPSCPASSAAAVVVLAQRMVQQQLLQAVLEHWTTWSLMCASLALAGWCGCMAASRSLSASQSTEVTSGNWAALSHHGSTPACLFTPCSAFLTGQTDQALWVPMI